MTVTVTVNELPTHPFVLVGVTVYTTVCGSAVTLFSVSVITPVPTAVVLSPVTFALAAATQLNVEITPFVTALCKATVTASRLHIVLATFAATGSG